jgi:hypothetical protein
MLDRTVLSRLLCAAAAVSLFSGCLFGGDEGSKGGVMVKPELIKSRPDAASALAKRGSAAAPHWTSDARILSYRVPVTQILVRNADWSHWSSVFDCAGAAAADCLVELNGPALEDLLGASARMVNQGTYGYVDLKTCREGENGYWAHVTAEVTLDGVTRYTHPTEILSATGPAQPLPIHYDGCGRSYNLPTPLVVSDSAGAAISFRLFFDIQDLVWAGLNERETQGAWAPGNCSGPTPGDAGGLPYVCAGYPDIAGTTDAAAPALERYYVNDGGIIGLYLSSTNDAFIGGYSRRYLREGYGNTAGFEAVTPVMVLGANGDGSYLLETGGGDPDPTIPYFRATAFRRAAHSGPYTAARHPGGTYNAVLIRP